MGSIVLKTKKAVVDFLELHPRERLEMVNGVRKKWWWMRPSSGVVVHAGAANAVVRSGLLYCEAHDFRRSVYRLKRNGE